jgi:hypothetical protein
VPTSAQKKVFAMTNIPEIPTEPDPVVTTDWLGEYRGDSITGIVAGRETFTSEKYKRDFDVLTIRNGSGEERRVPCARQHLAQLLAEHDPQPGDGIAIVYFGQEPGGLREQYAMRVSKQEDASEDVPV